MILALTGSMSCGIRVLLARIAIAVCAIAGAPASASPRVDDALPPLVVDRDNVLVERSASLRIPGPIEDRDRTGVITIRGSDLVVDLTGQVLDGRASGIAPDAYAGTGIRVSGRNVTIRGGTFIGFQVAILAEDAPGLTIEGATFADMRRQRLKSSVLAEHGDDWLWPHDNDAGEWADRYGAAIVVRRSAGAVIRSIEVRSSQNGILLESSDHAKIYDNDCSYLSGWGIAMWRSSACTITRNALDFCVRGYSHGKYNRGQDSAGILIFEQCNDNVIAENSLTHGGDGVFGFAGREALGERGQAQPQEWYAARGSNRNIFYANDLSDAAAHGLEMTFGTGNIIAGNLIERCAITGIWAGYCRETLIEGNTVSECGASGYGLENGGINIEHGARSIIRANSFSGNSVGIHLWWDADESLAATPWGRANDVSMSTATIARNTFRNEPIPWRLRDTKGVTHFSGNDLDDSCGGGEMTGDSPIDAAEVTEAESFVLDSSRILGNSRPVGARSDRRGRDKIVMTEWGPWDGESPLLRPLTIAGLWDQYEGLGTTLSAENVVTKGPVKLQFSAQGTRAAVIPARHDLLTPYEIALKTSDGGAAQTFRGVIWQVPWAGIAFAWNEIDPREDHEGWLEAGWAQPEECAARVMRFPFGALGPSDPAVGMPGTLRSANLPRDRFGIHLESLEFSIPAGRWRLTALADDGVRVWLNDELVLDDWSHHGVRPVSAELTFEDETIADMRLDYFEIDGAAHCELKWEFLGDL